MFQQPARWPEAPNVSAIAPPLLRNLQIAEGSNQVLKGLQWCCMAQEKGCSASQLQRGL